jgi:hypothetical protein
MYVSKTIKEHADEIMMYRYEYEFSYMEGCGSGLI